MMADVSTVMFKSFSGAALQISARGGAAARCVQRMCRQVACTTLEQLELVVLGQSRPSNQVFA